MEFAGPEGLSFDEMLGRGGAVVASVRAEVDEEAWLVFGFRT